MLLVLPLVGLLSTDCDFPLRVAETLLPGTEFHRYRRGGQTLVRSSSQYSVHSAVSQHLDFGGYIFCWVQTLESVLLDCHFIPKHLLCYK